MKTSLLSRSIACCLGFAITWSLQAETPKSPTINLAEPPSGLDVSPLKLKVVEAFPNLRISRPILITQTGDGTPDLIVGSQTGQIYWVPRDKEVEEPIPFMDIADRVEYKDKENEEGLLGLAFHPKFKENREFFIYYTSKSKAHLSVISRFKMKAGSTREGDPKSEEKLLEIQQPFWNHNGGTLAFGNDGYLYIALGDGGKANDPLQSGQDPKNLLGSVLRIDVDHKANGKPYAIPADNPFAKVAEAQPEIYAKGIRNIWRMAFDPKNGDLWAADVGQDLWEEVNIIRKGGNYGWSLRESAHVFEKHPQGGSPPRAELIDPIIEYPHTEAWGKSVTGGAVWRSPRIPELDGWYLYGDWVSGRLWGLNYDRATNKVIANRPIQWQQLPVFTFGQLSDGEVLFSTVSGQIYRFEKSE